MSAYNASWNAYPNIIFVPNYPTRGRDSVAGIETGYGLDDRGVGVRVPIGSRIFSSPRRPDRLWGPPNFLSNGYRVLFPRGESGRGVKLTTPFQLVPRSRKIGSIHSPHHIRLHDVVLVIRHRDNFTRQSKSAYICLVIISWEPQWETVVIKNKQWYENAVSVKTSCKKRTRDHRPQRGWENGEFTHSSNHSYALLYDAIHEGDFSGLKHREATILWGNDNKFILYVTWLWK
jgi:hypothetical protein